MMNRQQQRRLRKHPLIRFLRAILRIGRLIFGTAKKPLRPNLSVPIFEPPTGEIIAPPPVPPAPKRSITDPDLTVSEIFGLVQWQLPEPVKQVAKVVKQNIAAPQTTERGGIVNISKVKPQDQFVTVGELFELVKWKFSVQPDLGQISGMLTETPIRPQDYSLN
jgi:hypothetical protein